MCVGIGRPGGGRRRREGGSEKEREGGRREEQNRGKRRRRGARGRGKKNRRGVRGGFLTRKRQRGRWGAGGFLTQVKELTQSWSLAAGTLEGKRGSEAAPDSQISALWERGGGHPTSFSPLKSWLRDGQSAGPHPPEDLVGLSLSLPLGGTSRLTSKLAVSAFWLVLLSPMTCQNTRSLGSLGIFSLESICVGIPAGVMLTCWPWSSLGTAVEADVRWVVAEPGLLSFDLP